MSINRRILLGHKKNETMPLETKWMDPEIVILSEVSHNDKDKYHQFSSRLVVSNSL